MIFLDTGYFVAVFTPDDELHDRAAAWSASLERTVARLRVCSLGMCQRVLQAKGPGVGPRADRACALPSTVRTGPCLPRIVRRRTPVAPGAPGQGMVAHRLRVLSPDAGTGTHPRPGLRRPLRAGGV